MDRDHPVAGQPAIRADDAEAAVGVPGKTAAERADPKRTGAIGPECADLIAAQAILRPVVPEPARRVLEEAGAVRANPQSAGGVLRRGERGSGKRAERPGALTASAHGQSEDRVMPLDPNEYNYAPFFAALRQIRYDGLIGLEASSNDLQRDGPKSVALLRRALAR
jgi:hypothetical protein